jgi:cation transporter-like permease
MKMWTWGYNPHNYALPYVTSTADIIGTIALVAVLAVI